jgi:Holliday junction resolvase RusA-like endonuclease
MNRVTFTIEGRPVPWKRQRTNGKRRFPAKGQEEAKARVRAAFIEASDGLELTSDMAVALTVHAVFKLPQTLRKDDPRRMGSPHTMTPDIDNVGKLIMDALNGCAFYDDRQISELVIRSQWSDHNRTTVTLEYIPVDRMGRAA